AVTDFEGGGGAENIDGAGIRLEDVEDHADGGGLPGAVGTEKTMHAAARDDETHVIDSSERAELLADTAELQHVLLHLTPLLKPARRGGSAPSASGLPQGSRPETFGGGRYARKRLIWSATRRPSSMARTTSDWPRRQSPAANTFGLLVTNER